MSYDKAIMADIERRGKIYNKIKERMYWSAMGLSEQRRRHICLSAIRELEKHYKLVPLTQIEGDRL